MANLSGVNKYFSVAKEGFATTTSAPIASGATTVQLSSVAGYSNGDTVVLVIDAGDVAKKQAFTGTVDTGGTQITNVVWTEGANTSHIIGAPVIDYVTASHQSMTTKGLLVSHDQDGTLKAGAVDVAGVLASNVVETAKIKDGAITTPKLASGSVTADKNDFTTWNAGGYTSIVGQEIKTSNRSTGVSGTEVAWNGCATMSYNAVSGKRYKLTMHEYILDGYGGSGQMKFHFRHCSSGTWSSSGDMFCQSIIYVNSGGTAGVDTTVYFTAPTTGTAYVAIGFSSFGITGSFTIYASSTSPAQYTIERV